MLLASLLLLAVPAVANGHFCCYLSNVFLVILPLLLSMPLL
jgi:hypothetical protein